MQRELPGTESIQPSGDLKSVSADYFTHLKTTLRLEEGVATRVCQKILQDQHTYLKGLKTRLTGQAPGYIKSNSPETYVERLTLTRQATTNRFLNHSRQLCQRMACLLQNHPQQGDDPKKTKTKELFLPKSQPILTELSKPQAQSDLTLSFKDILPKLLDESILTTLETEIITFQAACIAIGKQLSKQAETSTTAEARDSLLNAADPNAPIEERMPLRV